MRFVRQYRFVLLFFLLLTFCSVMVVRQYNRQQSKHEEMRDAFILLYTRGYTNEAQRLYKKLLLDVPQYTKKLTDKELMDDFKSTLTLIDPDARGEHTNNLIWSYHWTVSNELDRRSESTLKRARKLAEEE
jgi:hypothetical protein